MELAEFLKAWRARAFIPQTQAAKLLGVSLRTYQSVEQGRGFRFEPMLRLAVEAIDARWEKAKEQC
jgi:DNA-binding XRE family transcriptional regulator